MIPLLATSSWRALYAHRDELDVMPVRISRGVPKFWPAAHDFPAVELLMPDGWMFSIADDEKFGRCYRRKLHQAGLSAVVAALEAIPSDGERLALCCFEAIDDPTPCHRHDFGRWWTRKTGELVPEWAGPGKLPRVLDDDHQPAPEGAER